MPRVGAGPVGGGQAAARGLGGVHREAAARAWDSPTGDVVQLSARTIEAWYYRYQSHGFAGLFPKVRRDKKVSRAVPEDLRPLVLEGLAMGFLYRSDTKMAQIETLVANVYAPVDERDAATDLVVAALIEEARAAGFRTLVGTTKLDAVVKRALKHGFTVDDGPYRLVTRVL